MINLFFSYSHNDEGLRNELDKHLSILKRQGVINSWHDRCVNAGSEFNSEISHNIKNANIILLLVSSDFLASDYCYENEMKLAMEMHDKGKAVVIPIILRPCDWHSTLFGKLLATPKDGKPVMKHASIDEAFLEITSEIKKVVQSISQSSDDDNLQETTAENRQNFSPRSSNLRIKKVFSDREKDEFLNEAFQYIANYFEESLSEMKKRNLHLDYRFNRVDSQNFSVSLYINGHAKTECKISYGTSMGSLNTISYSYSAAGRNNSFNESFSVIDDGYNLFLKPFGLSFSRQLKESLTFEGAAEYYWEMLIEPLQRN